MTCFVHVRAAAMVVQIALVILVCQCAAAQQPSRHVTPLDFVLDRGNHFRDALPFSDGFVSVFGRADWFFYSNRVALRFHNAEGRVTRDRKLELRANNQPAYLVHTIARNNTLLFVCAVPITQSSGMGWCILRYDFATDKTTDVLGVRSDNALSRSWLLNGRTALVYAPDSSYAAVVIFSQHRVNEPPAVNALVFSPANPTDHRVLNTALPHAASRYSDAEPMLDNAGQFYVAGKLYGGASEIAGREPNYHYVLHRAIDNVFQPVCSLTRRNRIVRSISGLFVDETFVAAGLITDSTLASVDSVFTARFDVDNCNALVESIAAFDEELPADTTEAHRFASRTFPIAGELVTVFEAHRLTANESARAGAAFNYERGPAVVVRTGADGRVKRVYNIAKKQAFTEDPHLSVHVFVHQGALYAAYVERADGDHWRHHRVVIRNLENGGVTERLLTNVDWKREVPYRLILRHGHIVLLQVQNRNYSAFRVPLP